MTEAGKKAEERHVEEVFHNTNQLSRKFEFSAKTKQVRKIQTSIETCPKKTEWFPQGQVLVFFKIKVYHSKAHQCMENCDIALGRQNYYKSHQKC